MMIETRDLKYPEIVDVIKYIENLNGTKEKEGKVGRNCDHRNTTTQMTQRQYPYNDYY